MYPIYTLPNEMLQQKSFSTNVSRPATCALPHHIVVGNMGKRKAVTNAHEYVIANYLSLTSFSEMF